MVHLFVTALFLFHDVYVDVNHHIIVQPHDTTVDLYIFLN
uniref:Uncharacterized protein n=1 Tax=Setaria italica TaxID=4555 RepID=K4AN52_SETIT